MKFKLNSKVKMNTVGVGCLFPRSRLCYYELVSSLLTRTMLASWILFFLKNGLQTLGFKIPLYSIKCSYICLCKLCVNSLTINYSNTQLISCLMTAWVWLG